MINEIVVRIIAERIITRGENPLRKRPFQLDDVTNEEYRKAVEDYIITNTADVTGVEEVTQ
ncbi:hypothetical protein K8O96_12200 [Clostridium sporogenes]|uniref:Uncharacterized protein n=1 Tax=Clostridium botulinum TaxID=1491 RepID=A0A6M0SV86_CLOBO|nr:hypothetical protein [Clostridium sporogenes]NFA59447.1 hypothetical protein [Clostridium botulinum]NFI74631.1 hypothetical protein [Clostridium sporogenes]NFL71234.1 hypothetical protein [Clostridium sporogenes]NFM25397.1 hypothetical protein [Clostridium sporogenes]NFP62507.1 hypothetical protein [Clostridium sporogenes]